jgi:hypothetical protein
MAGGHAGASLQLKTMTQMTQMTQWPAALCNDPTGRRGRVGPAAMGQRKRTGHKQFFYSHQLFLKIFFLVE